MATLTFHRGGSRSDDPGCHTSNTIAMINTLQMESLLHSPFTTNRESGQRRLRSLDSSQACVYIPENVEAVGLKKKLKKINNPISIECAIYLPSTAVFESAPVK